MIEPVDIRRLPAIATYVAPSVVKKLVPAKWPVLLNCTSVVLPPGPVLPPVLPPIRLKSVEDSQPFVVLPAWVMPSVNPVESAPPPVIGAVVFKRVLPANLRLNVFQSVELRYPLVLVPACAIVNVSVPADVTGDPLMVKMLAGSPDRATLVTVPVVLLRLSKNSQSVLLKNPFVVLPAWVMPSVSPVDRFPPPVSGPIVFRTVERGRNRVLDGRYCSAGISVEVKGRNVGIAAAPVDGPANTVLASSVASVTASVPAVVMGDPPTAKIDGIVRATLVTVPVVLLRLSKKFQSVLLRNPLVVLPACVIPIVKPVLREPPPVIGPVVFRTVESGRKLRLVLPANLLLKIFQSVDESHPSVLVPASVIESVKSVDRNPPPCNGKTVESVVLLARNRVLVEVSKKSVLVLLGRKSRLVLPASLLLKMFQSVEESHPDRVLPASVMVKVSVPAVVTGDPLIAKMSAGNPERETLVTVPLVLLPPPPPDAAIIWAVVELVSRRNRCILRRSLLGADAFASMRLR